MSRRARPSNGYLLGTSAARTPPTSVVRGSRIKQQTPVWANLRSTVAPRPRTKANLDQSRPKPPWAGGETGGLPASRGFHIKLMWRTLIEYPPRDIQRAASNTIERRISRRSLLVSVDRPTECEAGIGRQYNVSSRQSYVVYVLLFVYFPLLSDPATSPLLLPRPVSRLWARARAITLQSLSISVLIVSGYWAERKVWETTADTTARMFFIR